MARSIEQGSTGAVRAWNRRGRRFRFTAALAAVAASSSGCYRYSRVELDTVPASADVRLLLNSSDLDGEELEELTEARVISTELRPVVRGTLLDRNASTVMLGVRVQDQGGTFAPGAGTPIQQRVSIPVDAILDTEVRSLNRLGTGALVAGGVVGAALIIVAILGDAVAGDRPPDLDPDDEYRMPRPSPLSWSIGGRSLIP